jgi:hypothetical protein
LSWRAKTLRFRAIGFCLLHEGQLPGVLEGQREFRHRVISVPESAKARLGCILPGVI